MWHDTGLYFGPHEGSSWVEPIQSPENADGKRRIKNLIDRSGLGSRLAAVECTAASVDDILLVHTPEYLAEVQRVSDSGGGNLARRTGTTRLGSQGIEIALLAAGGALAAVRSVLEGEVENAYALIRPPGHHAEPGEALGFCIFANAAIAGLHALETGGLERIAFVDWDVHHGNGTQAVFWEDPRALTISLHQEDCYPPESGGVDETGAGDGAGTNLNIPLPPGCGEAAYLAAFDRVVLPALARYRPQLIVVPSGFDAGFHDPLGRMMLTSHSFRKLARRIMGAADELCGGKLVMTHEGGYSPHTVPFHCLAVLEEMAGFRTDVIDPYSPPDTEEPGEVPAHQAEAVGRAAGLVERIPLPG
ncbi:MAG: class II histone deacetylase [Rhodospirillales bacterium]|nr:class II histone deacetylase [Rhodospirillales bacterium]